MAFPDLRGVCAEGSQMAKLQVFLFPPVPFTFHQKPKISVDREETVCPPEGNLPVNSLQVLFLAMDSVSCVFLD